MLSDCPGSHFLGTAHNELRERTSSEIRRMLDQDLLFVRDSGFQPCGFGRKLSGSPHVADPLLFIVRLNAVQIKERAGQRVRYRVRNYFFGLYATQSISTFIFGSANLASTVVRAGLASPKNCA